MTDTWFPDLGRASGPKYRAIAGAIGAAIDSGVMGHGDRLPPQRALAARLGVDLTTVTRAYDLARKNGLVEARGRAGSFVAVRAMSSPSAMTPTDTGMNMPPEIGGRRLEQAMLATTGALLNAPGVSPLHYQLPGGAHDVRAAGSAMLTGLGIPSSEEQIVVAAGGQNALHAIINATLVPGDVVACSRHVYPGFRALAQRFGLQLAPLSTPSAAELEIACQQHGVRALYVVGTNNNPTTATISRAEREALVQVASHYGLHIIEDDAYAALSRDPVAPFASIAPHLTWHIASLSKILSPALRIAFVRSPSVRDALRLASDIHETAIMAPPLNAAIISAWLADGTFWQLVTATRDEAEARRSIAEAIFDDVAHFAHPQGYHLWLPLPEWLDEVDLAARMVASGLGVVPSRHFAASPEVADNAVRVSLGGPIERVRLTGALRVLHGHVTARTDRSAPLI